MLYHLFDALQEQFSWLRVFRYITFRGALAMLTSMVLFFAFGPGMIRMLKRLQVGQFIREEGPEHHQAKQGTPTMGGVLIVGVVTVSCLLWSRLDNMFSWLCLGALLAFAGIGFLDDYRKVVMKRNLGLTSKQKFFLQVVVGTGIGLALMKLTALGDFNTQLSVPFLKDLTPELGWLYLPFAILVVVGTSNAVNLTDGLDGLAIGSVLVAVATYGLFAYIAGHAVVAGYLGVQNVPGAGEVAVMASALVGSGIGFLWFNANPAEVFMGDVGSLSLGGAIGTIALVVKQELLLVVVGGVFVMEALSVMIQVASFKTRGKRVFRCAPIHHHFELGGWAETKVVIRFWILSILCSLVALSTLKLR